MTEPAALAQTLVNGVGLGCIYGLIAIGFCVIYNTSGIVNFAQGSFVMLGGMITHMLFVRTGLPFFVAAGIAVAVVAVIGVVMERLVVRPLWNRNATMFAMILATLAVQIVLERTTLIVAGDQPRTLPVFTDLPPLRMAGVAISFQLIWNIGCSLMMVAALTFSCRARKRERRCAPARSTGRRRPCREYACPGCLRWRLRSARAWGRSPAS